MLVIAGVAEGGADALARAARALRGGRQRAGGASPGALGGNASGVSWGADLSPPWGADLSPPELTWLVLAATARDAREAAAALLPLAPAFSVEPLDVRPGAAGAAALRARAAQVLRPTALDAAAACVLEVSAPPPPLPRTKWTRRVPQPRTNRTRRVPHPVLIGHVASLSQAGPTQATWGVRHAGRRRGAGCARGARGVCRRRGAGARGGGRGRLGALGLRAAAALRAVGKRALPGAAPLPWGPAAFALKSLSLLMKSFLALALALAPRSLHSRLCLNRLKPLKAVEGPPRPQVAAALTLAWDLDAARFGGAPPPPPLRTKWTCRVPHPVLNRTRRVPSGSAARAGAPHLPLPADPVQARGVAASAPPDAPRAARRVRLVRGEGRGVSG